jgi:hypothetical protein
VVGTGSAGEGTEGALEGNVSGGEGSEQAREGIGCGGEGTVSGGEGSELARGKIGSGGEGTGTVPGQDGWSREKVPDLRKTFPPAVRMRSGAWMEFWRPVGGG